MNPTGTLDEMSFPYAPHRPLTPITPAHSPHPSAGSIRSRTPGQLSLHDYRKQQVTPSPPAVYGQKKVKRKSAASSLKNYERISAESPSTVLLPPHHFTSTPPLTPSLDPPTPLHFQTSHPAKVGSSFTFYPELAHLSTSTVDLSPPESLSFSNPTSSEPLLPVHASPPPTSHLLYNFLSFERERPPDVSQYRQHHHGDCCDSQSQRSRSVQFSSEVSVQRPESRAREFPDNNNHEDHDTQPLLASALRDSGPGGFLGSVVPAVGRLSTRQVFQSAQSPVKWEDWKGRSGQEGKHQDASILQSASNGLHERYVIR